MRPVKSKAMGLFSVGACASDFESFERETKKAKTKAINVEKTKIKAQPKTTINLPPHLSGSASTKIRAYIKKREEDLFSEFKKEDWLLYWQDKAYEHGVTYRIGFYAKETSIMGALIKSFEIADIKNMIDFLWDAEHDLKEKKLMGTWILSKGWINTVVQCADMWRDGTYKTDAQRKKEQYQKPSRNREWTGDTNIDTTETKKKGRNIRL